MVKKIVAIAAIPLVALGIGIPVSADTGNVGKAKVTEYGFNAPGTDTAANRNAEFVRFANVSSNPLDIEGWTIHDGEGIDHVNAYVFKGTALAVGHLFRVNHDKNAPVPNDDPDGTKTPDHFVMPAGSQVYLYVGAGTDSTLTNNTAAVYRNYTHHHWNNAGDTIYLRDKDDTLIAWIRYTSYRVRIGQ